VLASIAALSGKPLPGGQGLDSTKQLPVLLNETGQIKEHPALVTASYGGFLTVRQGSWKAVFGTKWTGGVRAEKYGGPAPKGTPEDGPGIGQRYNLAEDPYETNDLWDRNPEVVKMLSQALDTIKDRDKSDPFPNQ
jgi:arylsulfatase A